MLKCKDIAKHGSEYLEGRINGTGDGRQSWLQRLNWRLHLLICINCRRFIKHLNLTCEMTAQKKTPAASLKEVEAVMAKLPKNIE